MRLLALCLALYHGLNGLVMAIWPDFWFSHVPGVISTGPLNVHFVRDTGLGFLSAAGAILLFAGTGERQLIWPALVFLGSHGSLHIASIMSGGTVNGDTLRDFLTIVLPGLLPLAFALGRKRLAVHP